MKLRNPFLVRLGVRTAVTLVRLVFKTCRVEERTAVPDTSPYRPTDEKFLYCIWHDGIVGVLFSGRQVELAGLTSRSADGSVVAETMKALRIPQVRGSSGKSGAAAVRQIRAMADHHMAITVDGPRGPRRQVKDGITYLASVTGRKIVPVAFEADRAWRPSAKWSDLTIPKPLSRVVIAAGEPIAVPKKLRGEALAYWTGEVERACLELSAEVERDVLGAERGPVEVRALRAA